MRSVKEREIEKERERERARERERERVGRERVPQVVTPKFRLRKHAKS